MKKYLIDESVIVYLDRADYQYHDQLVAFLEDGKVYDNKKKHLLYMSFAARVRLGAYRAYTATTFMKRFLKINSAALEPLEQAKLRTGIARTYVYKFLDIPFYVRFLLKIYPKKLSDLFIYANCAKSNDLQKRKRKKIAANELVSLTTCTVALIAHRHGLPVFSFNQDFQYLRRIPGSKKLYIRYINPDDFLKNYHHVTEK